MQDIQDWINARLPATGERWPGGMALNPEQSVRGLKTQKCGEHS